MFGEALLFSGLDIIFEAAHYLAFGILLIKRQQVNPFICHVQKVEKLKSLCLQYATSIQLLIPSIEVAAPEKKPKSGLSKSSRIKRSQERDQQLKLASENVVMSE